jgi:hypothetical protein
MNSTESVYESEKAFETGGRIGAKLFEKSSGKTLKNGKTVSNIFPGQAVYGKFKK